MSIPSTDPLALARATRALVQSHLASGRAIHLTVSTGSMAPTLAPGDRIVVRAADAEKLCLGDIVLAKLENSFCTHRLIARRVERGNLFLITKEDNCVEADQAMPAAELLGVVVAIKLTQSDGRVLDLQSARARRLNACIALVSRAQSFAQ